MLSRKRIQLALIALLVLAIVGWFAQQAFGVGEPGPQTGSLPGAEPVSRLAVSPVPAMDLGREGTAFARGPASTDGSTHGARETLVSHSFSGSSRIDDPAPTTVDPRP